MKKVTIPVDHNNGLWKTYIRKPDPIRAKLFEVGDQDGYAEVGKKVPYIRIHDGSRQIAAFGETYLTVDDNGLRRLVNKKLFEEHHDCIDG